MQYYLQLTHISTISEKNDQKIEDLELPLFKLDTIANATNNFSFNNKLGQGGFGPVYKVNSQHTSCRELLPKCLSF